MRFAQELAAARLGSASAPLLEKEGDTGAPALVAELHDPFHLHWACTRPALASRDQPVDPFEVGTWYWCWGVSAMTSKTWRM